MKCQILFSVKKKKNLINLSSAESAHSWLNTYVLNFRVQDDEHDFLYLSLSQEKKGLMTGDLNRPNSVCVSSHSSQGLQC